MADEKPKTPSAPAPASSAKKGGALGTILGIVLSAVFAAGGAFGGVKLGAMQSPHHEEKPQHEEAPAIPTVRAPGVTVPLETFLITTNDANGKSRAIKLTLALELRHKETEEAIKPFIPRIRDSALSYLRGIPFEEATSSQHVEKMRTELLERFTKLGAISIEQILITDFVTQ